MARLKNETVEIGPDGKAIHTIKSFNVKAPSAKFYMTFIEHVAPLFKISSPLDRKILDQLCCNAEFNIGKVIISSEKRTEICSTLGISHQTFNNSLVKLKKMRLISGERGVYEINPMIFWKGTTDEREKLLKEGGLELRIKFTHDGTMGEGAEGKAPEKD
jgi:hypothetical protein